MDQCFQVLYQQFQKFYHTTLRGVRMTENYIEVSRACMFDQKSYHLTTKTGQPPTGHGNHQ